MTILLIISLFLCLVLALETGYIFHDRQLQDRERTETRKQLKDLTDKLYFLQSKQEFIANKVIETPSSKETPKEEVQIPLEQVDPDTLADAFAHGQFA